MVRSGVSDPATRDRVSSIQKQLAEGLGKVDPHHRLGGRPVSYQVIAGQTLEIIFHDVLRVDDAELAGVKRLIGEPCAYSVSPQTSETLTVRFVVPLKGGMSTSP